jgi:hypothetical protein
MKKTTLILMAFFLLIGLNNGIAQNWQTYNFSTDGLPLSMNFPKQPTKKITEKTTKNYNYITVENGITYVAQATQAKKNLPFSVVEKSLAKITAKAKEVASQGNYTLNGNAGKQARYLTPRGVYTELRLVLVGNVVYQLMVLSEQEYPQNAEDFFKSAIFGK